MYNLCDTSKVEHEVVGEFCGAHTAGYLCGIGWHLL